MQNVLTRAFSEWANRPADERFATLDALHDHVSTVKAESVETMKSIADLKFAVATTKNGADIPVIKSDKGSATFSHWAFGQVARRLGAPPSYLRDLPADLAVKLLTHGQETMDQTEAKETRNLLMRQTPGSKMLQLRAMTTDHNNSGRNYRRLWNSEITARLKELVILNPNWRPAPEAFDGSRGLYASDKDIFAFMVDNNRRIFESGPGGGLGRGFFIWNSEVGDGSFGIETFWYEFVCGNHRVWGAKNVVSFKAKHVGAVDSRAFEKMRTQLAAYSGASSADDEALVQLARKTVLGKTREEVLLTVNSMKLPELPQKTVSAAYETAVQNEDRYGNPMSVWGFTGGLTQVARDLDNADDRDLLDRAAGKVMNKFATI